MSATKLIEQIDLAVRGHMQKQKVLQMAIVKGRRGPEPENLSDPAACRFGQWLRSGAIDPATRQSEAYKVVSRLHDEFHDCAGRVMKLARGYRPEEANALLAGEYKERTDKLMRALVLWKQELLAQERNRRVA